MKTKRKTVAEHKAELSHAENLTAIYSIALGHVMAGTAPVVSRGKLYTVRLMRPAGPTGGFVAVTFHPDGQTACTSVNTADSWREWVGRYTAGQDNAECDELRRHAEAVRAACYAAQVSDGWHAAPASV